MKNELCVVGLGHIGLPTAALFAQAGLQVAGADVSPKVLDAVNMGECPIEEPGLAALLKGVTRTNRLRATPHPVAADAFLIAVGTPISANCPDLTYVRSAAKAVGGVLAEGNLVVVESTVPPGTTAGLVRDCLERTSGLVAGKDFFLAHCAERAIPGATLREIVENDRLVGGMDPQSTNQAVALYGRLVKGQLVETDTITSEIVKLVENTYRDINIAFANELSRLCETLGADVWKVVSLANKHPRVNVHQPGPGVGGHCIPVVPWFLAAADQEAMPLIELCRKINDEQTRRVAARVLEALSMAPRPSRVAVLGLAYKSGTSDSRETPALPIIDRLLEARVDVRASDPHVKQFRQPVLPVADALEGADLLLILTDEKEYALLDPHEVATRVRSRLVFDTRNILDATAWRRAGFELTTLGVGRLLSQGPFPAVNGFRLAPIGAGGHA